MSDYLSYLQGAKQEFVSHGNVELGADFIGDTASNTVSKTYISDIEKSINSISKNITGAEDTQMDTIKRSPMNDILPFDDFSLLSEELKKDIELKYPFWYTRSLDDFNIYSAMLNEANGIINFLYPFNKEIPTNINITVLNEKIVNLFYYVFLSFIHSGEEIALYSIVNSYVKLSEDPKFERDRGKLFSIVWDTLILPISIKQVHLLVIKLLELWFGLDNDYKMLESFLKAKLLKK